MNKYIPKLNSIHIQNASVLMLGTLIAQFINLISSPIITRLYSPEQFGLFSLYTSVIGPLTVLCTMRLETALIIAGSPEEKSNLKSFIYRLTVAVTLFTLLAISIYYMIAGSISQKWYFLIPLGLLFNTILLVENADKNFLKKYSKISSAKVLQSFVMALFTIVFGHYLNLHYSLIIASILSLIVAWVFLRAPFDNLLTRKFMQGPKQKIIGPYSRYFYYTTPASLLDVVSQQIPIFILGYYSTKDMTGYYGLALKVLILPTHIIGASIAQVFLRRFSELWTDLSANLKLQLIKTWGSLTLLGLVPFGLLYFFGEELFSIVFGSQWAQAGVFASLIAPMLFINFISGPSSSAILVQNNHKMGLIFGLNALVTRACALFYGVYVDDLILGFKIWVVIEIVSMLAYNATIWHNITIRERGNK